EPPRRDRLHAGGRRRPAACPPAAAAGARRGGARRSRLRVLDAGRRARRRLGIGPELAARPSRRRPPACRSLSKEDVAHLLGRRPEAAVAVKPEGGGAGELPCRGLAPGSGPGGPVPPRAHYWRSQRTGKARGGG